MFKTKMNTYQFKITLTKIIYTCLGVILEIFGYAILKFVENHAKIKKYENWKQWLITEYGILTFNLLGWDGKFLWLKIGLKKLKRVYN